MIFAALALALFLLRLALLGALHVVPSPYHPVRHAVSDYAVGPTRRLSSTMSLLTALGWALLAAAVWVGLPDWSFRAPATQMLALLAALGVLLVLLPTDLEGERLTRRGLAHYAVAIASFGLAYSLTGDASRYAVGAGWGALGGTLVALHWVALVGLVGVVVGLVPRLRLVFGLVERVFLVSIAVFYALFSLGLLLN